MMTRWAFLMLAAGVVGMTSEDTTVPATGVVGMTSEDAMVAKLSLEKLITGLRPAANPNRLVETLKKCGENEISVAFGHSKIKCANFAHVEMGAQLVKSSLWEKAGGTSLDNAIKTAGDVTVLNHLENLGNGIRETALNFGDTGKNLVNITDRLGAARNFVFRLGLPAPPDHRVSPVEMKIAAHQSAKAIQEVAERGDVTLAKLNVLIHAAHHGVGLNEVNAVVKAVKYMVEQGRGADAVATLLFDFNKATGEACVEVAMNAGDDGLATATVDDVYLKYCDPDPTNDEFNGVERPIRRPIGLSEGEGKCVRQASMLHAFNMFAFTVFDGFYYEMTAHGSTGQGDALHDLPPPDPMGRRPSKEWTDGVYVDKPDWSQNHKMLFGEAMAEAVHGAEEWESRAADWGGKIGVAVGEGAQVSEASKRRTRGKNSNVFEAIGRAFSPGIAEEDAQDDNEQVVRQETSARKTKQNLFESIGKALSPGDEQEVIFDMDPQTLLPRTKSIFDPLWVLADHSAKLFTPGSPGTDEEGAHVVDAKVSKSGARKNKQSVPTPILAFSNLFSPGSD